VKLWEPDKRVVMTANTAWWDKPGGNVTEVIYTPINSGADHHAAEAAHAMSSL
jgi:peptide/nickel transport system substrate-binding protein